jgi:D-alanyl-lipoteichoic acid acyltransferase DltB (MBOAT superfamily)
MLFNSPEFLFYFLPITLVVFHVLRRVNYDLAIWSLTAASLYFYGSWKWSQSWIMFTSIPLNYLFGRWIERMRPARWPLAIGVGLNLALLGWYKYSKFFWTTAVGTENVPDVMRDLVLPLAISFFTFQQLAYLVDVWRGDLKDTSFQKYVFFVAFFPQLIAGPIVRYQDIDSQVDRLRGKRRAYASAFSIGLFFFAVGLFKKLYFADSIGKFANIFFERADYMQSISTSDAWLGVACYSLQLYFDFSGYSDMAIGLGRMFGFVIPLNFYSPYKAASIIDFWRRWHITLSQFFQEYLYIPLGGGRKGFARRCVNLLIVMALAGLWHGAGLTFVAWGLYHGVLLLVNHAWGAIPKPNVPRWWSIGWHLAARCMTLIAVMFGWMLFRSPTFKTAEVFFISMRHRIAYSDCLPYPGQYIVVYLLIAVLGCFALFMPNTAEWVGSWRHLRGAALRLRRGASGVFNARNATRLSWTNAAVLVVMLYFTLTGLKTVSSQFLYFNF